MSDKPLHVRVAEALGWKECDPEARSAPWEFHDDPPRIRVGLGIPPDGTERREIPRYDTDWSATGPLIEEYVAAVHRGAPFATADDSRSLVGWTALSIALADEWNGHSARGDTALVAVCNVILALAEAGKLKVA